MRNLKTTMRSLAIAGAAALAFTACQDDLQNVTDETTLGGGGVSGLSSALAVEWDDEYKRFVVVGEGPDGTLDAYVGDKGNFTKLPNNRDFNKWIGLNNFQDFAIGVGSNGKLDILGIMKDGRASTGREFSGKPWLGDNQFQIRE